MGFIAWIILGLLAGFIASKLVNHTGSGILLDIVIGVVGAIVGGFISVKLGLGPLEGFWSPWTWLVSILGAVVLLLIWNAVSKRA